MMNTEMIANDPLLVTPILSADDEKVVIKWDEGQIVRAGETLTPEDK